MKRRTAPAGKVVGRQLGVALLLLAGLCSMALAEPTLGQSSQDMLRTTGVQAAHVLDLWRLTLGICSAVFAAVLLAFLWAVWRAPRSDRQTPADLSSLQRTE